MTATIDIDNFDVSTLLDSGIDVNCARAVEVLRILAVESASTSTEFLDENVTDFSAFDKAAENYELRFSFQEQKHRRDEYASKSEITKLMQNSSLIQMFFVGFHGVEVDASQKLADVLAFRLDTMCHQLSVLADRKRRGRPCAFHNTVHQVLHMNRTSIPDLHHFYQSRVLRRCAKICAAFDASRTGEEVKKSGKTIVEESGKESPPLTASRKRKQNVCELSETKV